MKKTVKILGKEYDIETTIALQLSQMELTEIPKEVNELVNLTQLYLYHNKIKKIENIDNLVNLEKLYLNFNEIERIEGLDNNKNLKTIWIHNNKITKIENIHHLDKLEILYTYIDYVTKEEIEEAKRISRINSRVKKLSKV